MKNKITSFRFGNEDQKVKYIETTDVKPGVSCDVYEFDNDKDKDLAIVRVEPGKTTPLQLIVEGEVTIEGYVDGAGELSVIKKSGQIETHLFNKTKPGQVRLGIGDTMQWEADEEQGLTFFEICYPPYSDGRFQNLSE